MINVKLKNGEKEFFVSLGVKYKVIKIEIKIILFLVFRNMSSNILKN